MGSDTKTDNGKLHEKLFLRRYFLDKYHAGEALKVFDCCQGSGVLWGILKKEYQVESYWGVDMKPKRGRLRIDSARVLDCGLEENVIDIDTYGSPWKHFYILAKNVKRPTTVFLTWGIVRIGGGNIDKDTKAANGWDRFTLKPPQALFSKSQQNTLSSLLTCGCQNGNIIIEAKRVQADGNAAYIGLRIKPGGTPCQ